MGRSFLTAGRKVNSACGDVIAVGCSLHVEMWDYSSLTSFSKKNNVERRAAGAVGAVGHGWRMRRCGGSRGEMGGGAGRVGGGGS